MNKKMLRETVKDAIRFSDELDAQRAESFPSPSIRSWARLDGFLCKLAGDLADDMPEVSATMEALRKNACDNRNHLLDAADSNKEKSE